jgi:hypothetical protein
LFKGSHSVGPALRFGGIKQKTPTTVMKPSTKVILAIGALASAFLASSARSQTSETLLEAVWPPPVPDTNETFTEITNGRGGSWSQDTGVIDYGTDSKSTIGAGSDTEIDFTSLGAAHLVLTVEVASMTGALTSNGLFIGFQDSLGGNRWNKNGGPAFGLVVAGTDKAPFLGVRHVSPGGNPTTSKNNKFQSAPFDWGIVTTDSLNDGFTVVATLDSLGWKFEITGLEDSDGNPITGGEGTWEDISQFDWATFTGTMHAAFSTQGSVVMNIAHVKLEKKSGADPSISLPSTITLSNNGTLETLPVAVSNNGASKDLHISAVAFSGLDANAFSLSNGISLPMTIAPGGEDDLLVDVDPSLLPNAQPIEAFMTVTSDDPDRPEITVPIEGVKRDPWYQSDTALDLGTIPFSPGTLDFTLEITNDGANNDLTISDASFIDLSAEFTVTDDLGASPLVIGPGDTQPIRLHFDANGGAGTFEATLEVTSDDPLQEPTTIAVTITVDRDPEIFLPEQKVVAGPFPTGSGPQQIIVEVENYGANNTLTITPVLYGDDAGHFQIGTFDADIDPNGGLGEIHLTFDPQGGIGSFETTLEIQSNDPEFPTVEVRLQALVDPPARPGGLIAWWPLDDATNPGHDATGNGFDGVANGTIVQAPGATPKTGNAMNFDGVSVIDVPYDAYLNTRSFTVTLWANYDDATGSLSPLTNRDDEIDNGNNEGIILYKDDAQKWAAWTGLGTHRWKWNRIQSTNSASPETWTHLALTYDADTQTKIFYVNGTETGRQSVDYFPNPIEDLHIGSGGDKGTQYGFSGMIDDVAVFSTALPPSDILAIMNQGVAGLLNPPPKLALVGFNNGTWTFAATGLDPAKSYQLKRGANLESFPTPVGATVTGTTTATFTDPAPPSATAFYRIEETP